ncbi:hypothetical protein [Nitrosomonas nitrosa]|uniref:hypothetical protein n=1 Tax=Nitrosomonas nitrosa TaxID=52442 RepID=UPI0023F870DD|nr:hypothetical protein [Nitrosomonas nitrosa]MCO6434737.1 hypothetical protein [Nitrosomonas nitrosa]
MILSNTVQASVFYLGGARPPSDLMTVFIDKRCTIEIRTICHLPSASSHLLLMAPPTGILYQDYAPR